MLHHSSSDYDEAASAAAAKGREKMEEIIHKGQKGAEAVVAQIQNSQPRDKVVKANAVRLRDTAAGIVLSTGYSNLDENPIHPHAFGQIMATSGLGMDFVNNVRKASKTSQWGDELIASTTSEMFRRKDDKDRHLVRIDTDGGNRVKGFLSDRYRRLDSRPLADAFMGLCVETGLLPIEGVASDTKCRIRAVLPKVFEPIRNEVMIFGLEFGNSDYGDGGVVLNLWTMRMMCTNLAVTQKGIRQIHLGGRLPDDLHFSEATYKKDAEATASALADTGSQLIGPEPVHRMLAAVEKASEEEIKSADGIDKYLRGLSKGESNTVKQLFDSPDVVNMPEGQTVYRLSNAVSFFAQNRSIDVDRRIQLQELAGAIIAPDQSAKSIREV